MLHSKTTVHLLLVNEDKPTARNVSIFNAFAVERGGSERNDE